MSAVKDDSARLVPELAREVFERAAVGLVVISPDGVFRQVNAAFCQLLGYAREEVEGQSFRRFTHPDDVARDEEHLRLVRAGSEVVGAIDKRFLKKGGGEIWVRRMAAVVRDASGQARHVIGAFFDLTEQRAKDRELHTMNAFLTAVIETSPVAIYTTDLDGIVTFWNDAAERIFGFTREEALGRRAPFVTAEKREEAAALRARVLKGEVLTGLELERRRADGKAIVVNGSAAPLRDQAGAVSGLLVACIDVTEGKRAAAELEGHLHFTRALLDAIPNPVYFKDREGRYTTFNRAFHEIFGPAEDWRGKRVSDMLDPETARAHEEQDRPLLESPSSTTYEKRMTRGGSDQRELLFNKVTFVDRAGDVAGLIATVTDVTRYKEAERALEASEARFRVLTESSIDLITVLDAEGVIQYQSTALKHLLGYEPAVTIGRNISEFVGLSSVHPA